jgi:hypothetical protein
MAENKDPVPEPETKQDTIRVPEPETRPETKTVELGEGLRKGLDVVDAATPPVDQFRPNLDAPTPVTPKGEQSAQGSDQGSGGGAEGE